MSRIGAGPWDSEQVQHGKTRKALERLVAPGTPAAEQVRIARRLLRESSDLVACMLMSAFRAQAGQPDPPLSPLLPALRFRARRMLAGPSRQQGRDHEEALALLVHAPHLSDVVMVTERLSRREEPGFVHAIVLAGALLPFDEALRGRLEEVAARGDLDRDERAAVEAALRG
ncbi:MAG: hypothetical protein H6742_14430 [Alphaproteobacteria bacterium]|nr:hypothetical protein [Alphaproteobacteria bacterium]